LIGETSARRHHRLGVKSMGGKTVTRADLCEAVYQKVGLSRTESADLVELVLDEICASIVRGESVKLSSFGSFVVRKKGERIGRNPKTGEEVPISPRRVMVFKPSNVLKQRINAALVDGDAHRLMEGANEAAGGG
jgi:integration host factor subunit alpha